jgi:hypothetical protein
VVRHEHRLCFYFVFISRPSSLLQHTFSKSCTSSASSLKSHKACRISTFVRNGMNWKSMSVLKGLSRPYSWKMPPLLLMFHEHYITKFLTPHIQTFLLLNSFIKLLTVFTDSLVKCISINTKLWFSEYFTQIMWMLYILEMETDDYTICKNTYL